MAPGSGFFLPWLRCPHGAVARTEPVPYPPLSPLAPGRRRLDADRPSVRLISAPARVCFSLAASPDRHGLVQCRQQGFDLAEFGRSLMADAIDGAQQQPQPDLLGQGGKREGLERRTPALRRIAAIPASAR